MAVDGVRIKLALMFESPAAGMCENNPDDGGKMESAGLNDTLGAEVVIKQWLLVDQLVSDPSKVMPTRNKVIQLNYPPSMLFGKVPAKGWAPATSTAPVMHSPEPNIDFTWQMLDDNSTLLRMTHMYSVDEHPTLGQPTTVC